MLVALCNNAIVAFWKKLLHPKLRNVNFLDVTPSRVSQNLGNICSPFKSHSLLSHFPPIYHGFGH